MFIDNLIENIRQKNNPTVMGLDPLLEYVPKHIKDMAFNEHGISVMAAAKAILLFNIKIIDAIYDIIPCIKPQSAYYEMYGSHGTSVLRETIMYAKSKGLSVIVDAKRNDIGSTAEAYATAYLGNTEIMNGQSYDAFAADALTINAYLGDDGVLPFIKMCDKNDKGIFVLVKTSNPSSSQIQDLVLNNGMKVYEKMAEYVNEWGKGRIGVNGYSSIGAVVGATHPVEATNIRKVLVIGSGPIIIGQAAEFDYAGTQACRALKEEGIEVVLINSNPATIMTDINVADKVYIEPLTVEMLKKIIIKEKPDSILPTLGGQTGLNLAMELADSKFFGENDIKLLGTATETIKMAEDRQEFKTTMESIGEPCISSKVVNTIEDAIDFAAEIGYPVIVRPAYTMGGSGGGIVHNEKELFEIGTNGLHLSRVTQVLIERCISGWKEIEYEVMRDSKGNTITVCSMENIDPVGVHTGDSIVVAPVQTLSDKEYQMLRTASLNIIQALKIEGGCNVQLALHPTSFEYAVIEVNPRVSRSSALASKATGYPIAKVATKIAIGYGLDEIKNAVTGETYACFEPTLDYVVVKVPKWPFDKFVKAKKTLGTQMKATGEVMAISNSFEAALMKALRSLELGIYTIEQEAFKNLTKPVSYTHL